MRVSNFSVKNKLANYLLNGCKYRLQLDVGRGVGIRDVGYVGLGLQPDLGRTRSSSTFEFEKFEVFVRVRVRVRE